MAVSTKILPSGILSTVKRSRLAYAYGRRARFAMGSRLGARPVDGLTGRTHYNDFMLSSTKPADVARYRQSAVQFTDILQQSCAESGVDWHDVEQILEIGCGYGRIVRELAGRVSAERIFVCDIIKEAATFTAEEFGANLVPIDTLSGPHHAGHFDLVYLLSVYTHLPLADVASSLDTAAKLLRPGGLLVFTTLGEPSAASIGRYGEYWRHRQASVLDALRQHGSYHERYPYYFEDYGLTWCTESAVDELLGDAGSALSRVSFHPGLHDDHQDVYVYRRP
jgi:SAM-dependent methyltransferase